MRFFEFENQPIDKLINVLKNIIGRSSSKKSPAKMNWAGLNQMVGANGFELAMDYENFKAMYDSNPGLQSLIKNFNDSGIELNVPGAPESQPKSDGTDTAQDSQSAVDKIAASAAPQQLAQS